MDVGQILFSLDILANNCVLHHIFGRIVHDMVEEFLHKWRHV